MWEMESRVAICRRCRDIFQSPSGVAKAQQQVLNLVKRLHRRCRIVNRQRKRLDGYVHKKTIAYFGCCSNVHCAPSSMVSRSFRSSTGSRARKTCTTGINSSIVSPTATTISMVPPEALARFTNAVTSTACTKRGRP